MGWRRKRGGEKAAGERKGEDEKGTKRDKEVEGERLVIKLLPVFEFQVICNHTASYPLFYLEEELACLCWKESAFIHSIAEKTINGKVVIFFCTYYVCMLLFVSNSSFKNFHFQEKKITSASHQN